MAASKPHRWDRIGWLLAATGAAALGNGLWALVASEHGYASLASDTGPFDVHFVRDIGEAYAMVGVALLWAARTPRWRAPLTSVATVFLGLHALGHVYEIATGALDLHQRLEELPGVLLAAPVAAGMSVRSLRLARQGS